MKNWKTSAIGLLTAVASVVLPLVQSGTVDGKTILQAIGIAVLGFLAKDFNVTGGSVTQ